MTDGHDPMDVCGIPVIAAVCAVVGEGPVSLIGALFDLLAAAVGGAAAWLFEAMWFLIDETTLVDLTNPGYLTVYNLLFGVALAIVAIFFLAQLITGMIRRDPTALARAATGAAKAVLGSFVVVALATLLLEVTDQLTIGIVQAAGLTISEMGLRLGALFAGLSLLSIPAPGVGAIITIFFGCLAIAGVLVVWFSLLVRKALILAAIVLAPIALSGAAWDTTRAWFGRWAAFVVALIVSKLVIVLVMLVAVVQLDAPIDLDLQSIADPAAGIVLLLTAAFAPYLVYKLIAFAGFDMYHAISAEQEAKQSLNRPIPLPAAQPPSRGNSPATPSATPPDGDQGEASATPAADGAAGSGAPGGGAAAGGATASGGASAGGGAAASGGGAAGGAAAGGGAAAAAGPAAAVVVGAQVISEVAQAGPRAGATVAGGADAHAENAPPQPPTTPAPNSNSGGGGAPPAPPSSSPQPEEKA